MLYAVNWLGRVNADTCSILTVGTVGASSLVTMTKARKQAALYSFILGTAAHVIGYEETSSGLLSRNAAIYCLKANGLYSSTVNVNAYLAGVASVIFSGG